MSMEVKMNPARKRKGTSKSPSKFKRRKADAPAARLKSNAPERNSIDVNTQSNAFNSTGAFVLLNGTIPGDGLQNRKGRKIAMQSVMVRGLIRFDKAGTTPAWDYLRMMVVYDRQANGAAPVIGDILQSVNVSGTTASSAIDGLNLSNSDRFKILAEEVFGVSDDVTGGGSNTNLQAVVEHKPITFKRYIRLNGLETRYNTGTAGTIADINTGSLYFVLVGIPTSTDSQWTASWCSRVRFTDS